MVKQIEYLCEVRNKAGKVIKKTYVRINKEKGLYAEFLRGNPDQAEENKNPSVFYLKNEDYGLLPNDKLFEEFNKIFFPKVTNFYDKRMADKATWLLTVDKVEYFGNSEPDFYQKVYSLMKIKDIEKHMSFYVK